MVLWRCYVSIAPRKSQRLVMALRPLVLSAFLHFNIHLKNIGIKLFYTYALTCVPVCVHLILSLMQCAVSFLFSRQPENFNYKA